MRHGQEINMIKEESKREVENFLKWHKDPLVRVAARNMKDGYVACIDPIPNICGPELMCSPSTRKHLIRLIRIIDINENMQQS